MAGLAIDNLEIEVTGPEVPGMDGSCLPFVEALTSVGVRGENRIEINFFILRPFFRMGAIEFDCCSGELLGL